MKYIVTFGIVILISFFASCNEESLSPPLVDPAMEYVSETEVSVTWEFATTEEQATFAGKDLILKEHPIYADSGNWDNKYKYFVFNLSESSGKIEYDIVSIEEANAYHEYPIELEIANSKFLSYPGGENGGTFVYQTNGTEEDIMDGININWIYAANDNIYVLEGNYFVWEPSGGIRKVAIVDGKLNISNIVDISDVPTAAFVDSNGDVYIFTLNRLILIRDEKIEKTLIENAFWGGLYPRSFIKLGNVLYIGMRGGIASYNLETGELLWYEKISEGE